MKLCKKCGEPIPSRIHVDGCIIGVSKTRVNCFVCTPRVELQTMTPGQRVCPECNRPHSARGTLCSSCYVTKWRKKIKLKSIEYLGGACYDCGFNSHPAAMEFHHREPHTKEFATSASRSWERTKAELDKCDLLCANCHRIRHSK